MVTREQFEEILDALQKEEAYSPFDWERCDIWEKYAVKVTIVERDRGIDRHRWYELSETIMQIGDWFIGMYGATNLYSESDDYENVGIRVAFYEVEQVEVKVMDYIPVE